MAKMGRPKGVPNVYTREVRELIREALDKLGGTKYLVQLGKDNPNAFVALLGRTIPKEVEAQVDTKLEITWMKPEDDK